MEILAILANKDLSNNNMELILRNYLSKTSQYDVPIKQHHLVVKTIVAEVSDIDIEKNYKELTIVDLSLEMPLIIDLTYAQADEIRDLGIEVGQILLLTITSKINSFGLTGTWQLQNIDEIIA